MEFGLFVDPVALYRKATDGPSMGVGGFIVTALVLDRLSKNNS